MSETFASYMNIRLASSSDSNALSQIILEASVIVKESDFSNEGWGMLKRTNTSQAFNKRFESASYFCVVYEVDQKVVGYIAMLDHEKIDHMFVLPNYRAKGICKELWAVAKERCLESGNRGYFWVRSSSYAEPVYTSFGFRSSSERQSSNGISFRFMELGLKQEQ